MFVDTITLKVESSGTNDKVKAKVLDKEPLPGQNVLKAEGPYLIGEFRLGISVSTSGSNFMRSFTAIFRENRRSTPAMRLQSSVMVAVRQYLCRRISVRSITSSTVSLAFE
jgi:hypothetical protein